MCVNWSNCTEDISFSLHFIRSFSLSFQLPHESIKTVYHCSTATFCCRLILKGFQFNFIGNFLFNFCYVDLHEAFEGQITPGNFNFLSGHCFLKSIHLSSDVIKTSKSRRTPPPPSLLQRIYKNLKCDIVFSLATAM